MTVDAETVSLHDGRRVRDRVAASFLFVLMALGCVVLFIGIPAGVLWALSKTTDSSTDHFVLGLILVPVAMALFAPALFWINRLYLRVTGVLHAHDDEDEDEERRLSGPLEPLLYTSMAIALIALFVWFFVFARNPPEIVW